VIRSVADFDVDVVEAALTETMAPINEAGEIDVDPHYGIRSGASQ
jgi:hypothetical protein